MKINEYLSDFASINSFQIEGIDVKYLFDWLTLKKNTIEIFNNQEFLKSQKQFPNHKLKDHFKHKFSSINILCALVEFHKHVKASDFYVIYEKKTKGADIEKISFDYTDEIENFIQTMQVIKLAIINRVDVLGKQYKRISIYFPFKIGNVLSKDRYLYEVNAFYMDSFISYKSFDEGRGSTINNWSIDRPQALLNELNQNYSMFYNNNYAYLDFIKIYQQGRLVPTDFLNLSFPDIRISINILDKNYFYAVINQQKAFVNAIENELDIAENKEMKGTKKSLSSFLLTLQRSLKSNKQKGSKEEYNNLVKILIQLRNKVKNIKMSTGISKLIKSEKENNDDKNKILLAILLKFPLVNNKDIFASTMEQISKEIGNKLDKDKAEDLVNMVFGNESPLYEKKDKRKVFFTDMKQYFNIYHSSGYSSKDIKYFLNSNWIKEAKQAYTKLANYVTIK